MRNAKEFTSVSSTQSEIREGPDRFKCLLLRLRSGSLCFIARSGDSNGHCGNARWVLVMYVEGVFIAVEPQRQRLANAFACLAEAAAVRLTSFETFDRDSPSVALVAFVDGGVGHVNQPFPRQLSRERSIDRRVPARDVLSVVDGNHGLAASRAPDDDVRAALADAFAAKSFDDSQQRSTGHVSSVLDDPSAKQPLGAPTNDRCRLSAIVSTLSANDPKLAGIRQENFSARTIQKSL